MSFADLPPNIRALALTDQTLAADVVDLMIAERDRVLGSVGVMLCDNGSRGVQPIVVNDVPEDTSQDGLSRLLELLLPMVEPGGGVLIGRGRPHGLVPTDTDRQWHQLAIDACAASGVRLLGYHLATLEGISPLPAALSAAS